MCMYLFLSSEGMCHRTRVKVRKHYGQFSPSSTWVLEVKLKWSAPYLPRRLTGPRCHS